MTESNHPPHNPLVDSPDQKRQKRARTLHGIETRLEMPMVVLGFIWLLLLGVELVYGLSPFLEAASTTIWVLFIIEFAAKLFLATNKIAYLKSNWLTTLALLLPALRVLRVVRAFAILRAARTARGMRLIKVVASTNRSMKGIKAAMKHHGLGYVLALTAVVVLAGAAGMYAFERHTSAGEVDSYGAALWWTAMIVTTIGSDYWPRTPEGRILCFLLSLYSLGTLGYVTASLASYFIGRVPRSTEGPVGSGVRANTQSQPLIAVSDVEASSRWYQHLLNCQSAHGGTEYERLVAEGKLILQLHSFEEQHDHGSIGDPRDKPYGNGVLLWFEVIDFDAAVARAVDMNAAVVLPRHRNPPSGEGGPNHWECWLRDPDGYTVVLASPDGSAAAGK